MLRANFRSRHAPIPHYHEVMRPPPHLVLLRGGGGRSRTPDTTSADLVQLLIRIWNPWDFQTREKTSDEPILEESWIDEIIRETPPAVPTEVRYLNITRSALGTVPKPKAKPKPRESAAKDLPYRVESKALGDFVRFFFDTGESVRGFIQRRLAKRHGKHVVQTMDYAQLAHLRELERKSLINHLNTLVAKHGKRLRDSDEWRVRYERKGRPPKVFFVEIDVQTNKIIKVLLEKDRNRRKSHKTARRRCYQRYHR